MNPFDILKNAQRLQEQMGELQEKLGGITVTGYAGGGMAQVEMNGKMEVLAVHLDPELITAGEAEVLEDLVAGAFSSAMEKVKEAITRELGAMAGGLGGLALPFGLSPGAGAGGA